MGSFYKEINESEIAVVRDILFSHHKDMKKLSPSNKKLLMKIASSGGLNVSMLLEQAISHVSGLKQSNKTGEDHADGSETKFCSINYGPNGGGYFAHTGSIGNLGCKKGSLRVIVYVQTTEKLKYYYIPYPKWKKFTCHSGKAMRLSYNTKLDRISKIYPYEVSSFANLCLKK